MTAEHATAADWTVDPTGRSNSSQAYRAVVREVQLLLEAEFRVIDKTLIYRAAALIVAQLAHVHGIGPAPAIHEAERKRMFGNGDPEQYHGLIKLTRAEAAIAERQRIRQLAAEVGATYATADTPAGTLDDIGLMPFAGLLGEPCQCVLGESPWCLVHHPELADATDAEKLAAKLTWEARTPAPPAVPGEATSPATDATPARPEAAPRTGREPSP